METGQDAPSDSATAAPAAGKSKLEAAPSSIGGSPLARLLAGIAPYVDSVGIDGLSDLVTDDNVRSVSNFAQGLLKQMLATE